MVGQTNTLLTPDDRETLTLTTPNEVGGFAFRSTAISATKGGLMFTVKRSGQTELIPELIPEAEASYRNYRLRALRFVHPEPESEAQRETQQPFSILVCQGELYELSSTYVGGTPFEPFEDFLAQFTIKESEAGMTLRAASHSDFKVETRLLASAAPDIADITTYLAPSGATRPGQSGIEVQGGEMWQMANPDRVVIGNENTLTEVIPHHRDEADLDEGNAVAPGPNDAEAFQEMVEELSVELRPR